MIKLRKDLKKADRRLVEIDGLVDYTVGALGAILDIYKDGSFEKEKGELTITILMEV